MPLAEQQRTTDAQMIAAAWRAGGGSVRVQSCGIGAPPAAEALQRALAARAVAPAAPILILTSGFVPTLGIYVRGNRNAWAFLQCILAQCPPRALTL
jgi:hypothetical protein